MVSVCFVCRIKFLNLLTSIIAIIGHALLTRYAGCMAIGKGSSQNASMVIQVMRVCLGGWLREVMTSGDAVSVLIITCFECCVIDLRGSGSGSG